MTIACGGRAPAPAPIDNRAAEPAPPDAGGVPADVAALIERWEMCQHWAGEEPYDEERRQEILRGIAASCPGNEDTRAALERRYADRPDVLAKLRELEI